jgi:hypothetical protein
VKSADGGRNGKKAEIIMKIYAEGKNFPTPRGNDAE